MSDRTVSEKIILALPSKGRLMEDCNALFERAGYRISKAGAARGYRGVVEGRDDIDVHFVSSSEIAQLLQLGDVHLGVTGEDLMRDAATEAEARVVFHHKLGFGYADVVVAVPQCWLDVRRLEHIEPMAMRYRKAHERRIRVATKYLNLTRRAFAEAGIASYRIVESLGATEGAPAAGLAELIVDITTTGATLKANGLKILDDGVLLKSEANLVGSKTARRTLRQRVIGDEIVARVGKALAAG